MEALQNAPGSSLWNKQALMTLPPGALKEVLVALQEDIDLLSVELMTQLAAREQLAEESEGLETRIEQMVWQLRFAPPTSTPQPPSHCSCILGVTRCPATDVHVLDEDMMSGHELAPGLLLCGARRWVWAGL